MLIHTFLFTRYHSEEADLRKKKRKFLVNIFICPRFVIDADTISPGASGKSRDSFQKKRVILVLKFPIDS